PIAQPSVDKKFSESSISDTFNFYDYSILKYAGAKREWSFSPAPVYVSNPNTLRPKVVFGNAGKYAVTLKVTDSLGNVSSKTINDMVEVFDYTELAIVDSVAGEAASFSGSEQY